MPIIEPVRVGVDIDGVMAPTGWKTPPWHVHNGWERQPVLDAEGLAELAHRARSDAWEVYAITARPTGPGSTTQQQTRRWLERHDAGELSVVIDRGKRRKIVRALDLDWLVDDTLSNCCTAQTGNRGAGHLDRAQSGATGTRRGGIRRMLYRGLARGSRGGDRRLINRTNTRRRGRARARPRPWRTSQIRDDIETVDTSCKSHGGATAEHAQDRRSDRPRIHQRRHVTTRNQRSQHHGRASAR